MFSKSVRRSGAAGLAAAVMLLWLVLPAAEAAESSSQEGQQETVYEGFKRKAKEWFGDGEKPAQEKKSAPPKAEPAPDKSPSGEKSDGRKAIDKFKGTMKKASDNLSETVDRDKKTVEKKMQNLFGSKKE